MKKKTNQNFWGFFIILFLIYQLIKFGIANDWFVKKPKDNLNIKELNFNICKVFSLSVAECNKYKKTKELPKRVQDKLDEITKKIESNSLNQSSIHEKEK